MLERKKHATRNSRHHVSGQKSTSKYNNLSKSPTELQKANNRRIIAEFLYDIPDNVGWWYRLPQLRSGAPKNSRINDMDPDLIMPHLGSIFGLTEEAIAIVLIEMGCLRVHGNRSVICEKGWEYLSAEFGMKDRVEHTKTKLSGKEYWHIRLGFPPPKLSTPYQIFKCFTTANHTNISPPRQLNDRRAEKFVTSQLVHVMKNSYLFEKMLGNYVETYCLERIGYTQRVIRLALEDYKGMF